MRGVIQGVLYGALPRSEVADYVRSGFTERASEFSARLRRGEKFSLAHPQRTKGTTKLLELFIENCRKFSDLTCVV